MQHRSRRLRAELSVINCKLFPTQAASFVVRAGLLLMGTLIAAGAAQTSCAQDCSSVVHSYRSSVVSIEVKKTAKDTGAVSTQHGTGFIIDQEGYVLTSSSIFSTDEKEVDAGSLTINGSTGSQKAPKEPMEFVTSSLVGEVAVLRFLDTSKDRNPISVGDPWSIRDGQFVCYIGFPLDIEYLTKPGTVTGKGATKGWWYSDIAYNLGTAGSPVFDTRSGNVIGFVGVKIGTEVDARGVGYIVPINLADVFLHTYANIEIRRESAQTLASGLQRLQVNGTSTASPVTTRSSTELRDRGLSLLAVIWPTAQIFVCWENPSPQFQREMSLVRQEVAETWERESLLRFKGWQKCAPENRGIRILIEDSGPDTKGLGRELDGKPNGIVLNFTFVKWASSCQETRDYCIKAIAGHMFGHAIGFSNTQNRPDTPGECTEQAEGETVDVMLTPYDPNSIMNYCNPKFNNDGKLSVLDIAALRTLYGAPVKGESGH